MSKRQRIAGHIVVCETEEPIIHEMDQVHARIRERAFEISLNRGHAGREIDDWLSAESEVIMSPPLELAERNDTFIIRMVAAGMEADDLTVMAARDHLLVKGEFRHEHEAEATIHSCEFRSAMLLRSLRLPGPIDLRSIHMQLHEGVLRITAEREGAVQRSEREIEEPAKKRAVKSATKSKSFRKSD